MYPKNPRNALHNNNNNFRLIFLSVVWFAVYAKVVVIAAIRAHKLFSFCLLIEALLFSCFSCCCCCCCCFLLLLLLLPATAGVNI